MKAQSLSFESTLSVEMNFTNEDWLDDLKPPIQLTKQSESFDNRNNYLNRTKSILPENSYSQQSIDDQLKTLIYQYNLVEELFPRESMIECLCADMKCNECDINHKIDLKRQHKRLTRRITKYLSRNFFQIQQFFFTKYNIRIDTLNEWILQHQKLADYRNCKQYFIFRCCDCKTYYGQGDSVKIMYVKGDLRKCKKCSTHDDGFIEEIIEHDLATTFQYQNNTQIFGDFSSLAQPPLLMM